MNTDEFLDSFIWIVGTGSSKLPEEHLFMEALPSRRKQTTNSVAAYTRAEVSYCNKEYVVPLCADRAVSCTVGSL